MTSLIKISKKKNIKQRKESQLTLKMSLRSNDWRGLPEEAKGREEAEEKASLRRGFELVVAPLAKNCGGFKAGEVLLL